MSKRVGCPQVSACLRRVAGSSGQGGANPHRGGLVRKRSAEICCGTNPSLQHVLERRKVCLSNAKISADRGPARGLRALGHARRGRGGDRRQDPRGALVCQVAFVASHAHKLCAQAGILANVGSDGLVECLQMGNAVDRVLEVGAHNLAASTGLFGVLAILVAATLSLELLGLLVGQAVRRNEAGQLLGVHLEHLVGPLLDDGLHAAKSGCAVRVVVLAGAAGLGLGSGVGAARGGRGGRQRCGQWLGQLRDMAVAQELLVKDARARLSGRNSRCHHQRGRRRRAEQPDAWQRRRHAGKGHRIVRRLRPEEETRRAKMRAGRAQKRLQ
eukprot:m.368363 g.368363  ORF g.368363 m.368363 type:complete len:328 (+) comp56100_c0_seq2:98-1081(+)